MNEVIIKNKIKMEDLIYNVRGKQVMLDSDLAKQYKVETKTLMQAVKRNIERFPDNFMFQLTDQEYKDLRSQIVTSKRRGGRRYNPYAFTEQGVAMLSGLLRSETAIQTSISIINTFVKMRQFIREGLIEQRYINNLVIKHDEKLKAIVEMFDKLDEKRKINKIYFNGQIYDAISKIQDIFKSALNKLIIIDAYADKTILDIIRNLDVEVIVITKKNGLLKKLDIDSYNKQYNNLKVIYDDSFHDRYFIVDNVVYHCGTSINRIGYKTFSINLISDEFVSCKLIDRVNKIIEDN